MTNVGTPAKGGKGLTIGMAAAAVVAVAATVAASAGSAPLAVIGSMKS